MGSESVVLVAVPRNLLVNGTVGQYKKCRLVSAQKSGWNIKISYENG